MVVFGSTAVGRCVNTSMKCIHTVSRNLAVSRETNRSYMPLKLAFCQNINYGKVCVVQIETLTSVQLLVHECINRRG